MSATRVHIGQDAEKEAQRYKKRDQTKIYLGNTHDLWKITKLKKHGKASNAEFAAHLLEIHLETCRECFTQTDIMNEIVSEDLASSAQTETPMCVVSTPNLPSVRFTKSGSPDFLKSQKKTKNVVVVTEESATKCNQAPQQESTTTSTGICIDEAVCGVDSCHDIADKDEIEVTTTNLVNNDSNVAWKSIRIKQENVEEIIDDDCGVEVSSTNLRDYCTGVQPDLKEASYRKEERTLNRSENHWKVTDADSQTDNDFHTDLSTSTSIDHVYNTTECQNSDLLEEDVPVHIKLENDSTNTTGISDSTKSTCREPQNDIKNSNQTDSSSRNNPFPIGIHQVEGSFILMRDSTNLAVHQNHTSVSGNHTKISKDEGTRNVNRHVETHSTVTAFSSCPDVGYSDKFVQTVNISDLRTRQFLCNECGKGFHFNCQLKEHLKTHTNDRPFVCKECGKGYKKKSHLKEHLMIHSNDRPFVCDECGKGFHRKSKLKEHSMIHKKERPFVCLECGKGFKQSCTLKEHIKIHANESSLVCKECGNEFKQKADLKRHIKMIHTKETFFCRECGKDFHHVSQLNIHMKMHSNVRPFVCKQCAKRFKRQSHLKEHMMIHTNERPFICKECGKGFHRSHKLKEHVMIHANERQFVCQDCGRGFNQLGTLKKHMKIHTNEIV
ncbi:uncharacterized protein LOC144434234 [Glandiceps talaboti]